MTDKQHGHLLGEKTEYVSRYDPSLLCPIPRQLNRSELGIVDDALPFYGQDMWTGYELSWLENSGKPQVAVAEFRVPADSPSIIESKSFKLYLNSLNQSHFAAWASVEKVLKKDLSAAAGAPVEVQLMTLADATNRGLFSLQAESLDGEQVNIDCYQPNAELLKLHESGEFVDETLCSDLLKSNCPVTGQPDWASLLIRYRGACIDRGSLLRYIVSFREHQDFHEHCVERMFLDIQARCQPEQLTLYARYTRRGGLDINPYRSTDNTLPDGLRLSRQ